jgi:hypothetical protein
MIWRLIDVQKIEKPTGCVGGCCGFVWARTEEDEVYETLQSGQRAEAVTTACTECARVEEREHLL